MSTPTSHHPRPRREAAARFRVAPRDNLPLRVNELFIAQEDLRCPRFASLRERFRRDAAR